MSAPTEQFGKLQLGQQDMPTIRSQSRAKSSKPSAHAGSTSSRHADSPTPSANTDHSNSSDKTETDVGHGQLIPATLQQAEASLGDFEVQHCTEYLSKPPGYYAFRVVPVLKNVGIRIGGPETSYQEPTCSCATFHETQPACQHIHWLSSQIQKAFVENCGDDAVPGMGPFEQVSAVGLEKIANNLGWPCQPRALSPDEGTFTSLDQIRDILSTFDPERSLPENYLDDVYEELRTEEENSDEIAPTDSLPTVIFRLAGRNDAFFRPLREAIHGDYCASVYVQKLAERAQDVFRRTDAFYRQGESSTGAAVAPDTAWSARALRSIVHALRRNLELRAPLADAVKARACHLLLSILDEVCNRDDGAHDGVVTRATDDNLYRTLVGRGGRGGHGPFVLDALWDLGPVAGDHLAKVDEISDKVAGQGAPAAFVAELRRFRDHLEAGDAPTGAVPPAKRPAGADLRGRQKRMK